VADDLTGAANLAVEIAVADWNARLVRHLADLPSSFHPLDRVGLPQ
jgi:hypothetical protein